MSVLTRILVVSLLLSTNIRAEEVNLFGHFFKGADRQEEPEIAVSVPEIPSPNGR